MIVCQVYPNDNNHVLKNIQHDLYEAIEFYLIEYAKTRFLKAANLLRQNSELVEKLKMLESFDHRVLQDTHDIIAARYRYLHDDGGQIDLLSASPQKETYRTNWIQWFHQETRSLVDNDEFCRAVVTSVVFQNTECGYQAEDQLKEFLTYHYSTDDWLN
jgi:hypothetical protein